MSDTDQNEKPMQGPKRVTVEGQTVEEHSVQDQITADQYNDTEAAKKPHRGLRFTQLRGPAAG